MTFMDMAPLPGTLQAAPRGDVILKRAINPDPDSYAALFRAVGQEWLWQARLDHTQDEIATLIRHPTTEIYYLYDLPGETPLGLLELDFSDPDNANLAYFGLVPEAIGRGLGGFLLRSGIDIVAAHDPKPTRFWFNTCTFDHPSALPFYKHLGFRVYRENVPDTFPDPRLNNNLYGGAFPLTAAPHVPLAINKGPSPWKTSPLSHT